MTRGPDRRSGARVGTAASARTGRPPAARRRTLAAASAASSGGGRGRGTGGKGDAGDRRTGRPRGPGGRPRASLGGEQVEGRRAVRELLAAGRRPVHEVWMADDLDPAPILGDIERLATRRRVRLVVVSRRRLDAAARTDAPQGVLARAQPLPEIDLDDLCRTRGATVPFLLVLDGVTDPHNLGSLLRSAECAGVTGIVLPRHRAAHVTPTVAKVAAGAVEHLDMAIVAGVPNALLRLADAGVVCVGLDASSPESLFALGPEAHGAVALVIGAEGRGLAALTRRRCARLVSIPQHGAIESLNVAAAGAVACFTLAQWRQADAPPVDPTPSVPPPRGTRVATEPVVGVEPTT